MAKHCIDLNIHLIFIILSFYIQLIRAKVDSLEILEIKKAVQAGRNIVNEQTDFVISPVLRAATDAWIWGDGRF